MNAYEIAYLEGELGHMLITTEYGETEDEAVEKAKEDYYFWKLIHVNLIEENVDI